MGTRNLDLCRWGLVVQLALTAACGDDSAAGGGGQGATTGSTTAGNPTGSTSGAATSSGPGSGGESGSTDAGPGSGGAGTATSGNGGSGAGSTGSTGTGSGAGGSGGGSGSGGQTASSWSEPISLVDDLGRLAFGNRVHVVGHIGGQLAHRSSSDEGASWSTSNVIAPASGNFPAMYGGLFSQGDAVFLLTAPAEMASSAGVGGQQLDFRRSSDNGSTWSNPVRITQDGYPIFRARIVASGNYVHVSGVSSPTSDASHWYYRSTDGGATWESPVAIATNLGVYGGGQTVAVEGATVHIAYTLVPDGFVGQGPATYVRSTDDGATWSNPVAIGEVSAGSSRQSRIQLSAAGGRVFAIWQREGSPFPTDRMGYNRSDDGGQTWGVARVLPEDTGVDRNHQHVTMTADGRVHVVWRHGDSGDATPDYAGYMVSTDFGEAWSSSGVAIDTTSTLGTNHPWNIVASTTSVHLLAGPSGAMQYARRPLP